MSGAGAQAYLDELLQHETWARRLAFRLVRDAAAADDLVQEAWLAALRQRPDTRRSLRPWLGGVLRNLVRMRFRSAARRARREGAAAPSGLAPDPAELAERLETHRRLAAAVGELEADYRNVVFLRYYEDLNSSEIGKRLGLPPGTVRWRLSKALVEVRAKLEAERGAGLAWVMPLLPLAAACPGAARLLETAAATGAGTGAGAGAAAAEGRAAVSTWLAWTAAATGVVVSCWLGLELRSMTRLLDLQPPTAPSAAADENLRLRADLHRGRERLLVLERELATAREELARTSSAPAAPVAAPPPAAGEELSAEMLASLRELADLMEEGQAIIDGLQELGVNPARMMPDPGGGPEVAELFARRSRNMQRAAVVVLPLMQGGPSAGAFVGALESEADPALQRALATVVLSRTLAMPGRAGGPDRDVSDRLARLFGRPGLDPRVRAMLLPAIDLSTEAGRAVRDEVFRLAAVGESPELRDSAVRALAGVEGTEADNLLRRLARDDPAEQVRGAAIVALATRHAGTKDPGVLTLLDDLEAANRSPRLSEVIGTAREMVAGR